MEFCTPVYAWESTSNPHLLKRVHMADFIYIMKNMAYMEYLDGNGVGGWEESGCCSQGI